jgi:hypothetical protein
MKNKGPTIFSAISMATDKGHGNFMEKMDFMKL